MFLKSLEDSFTVADGVQPMVSCSCLTQGTGPGMVSVVLKTQSNGENCLNWNYSLATTDRAEDTMEAAVPAGNATEGKIEHQSRWEFDCCCESLMETLKGQVSRTNNKDTT